MIFRDRRDAGKRLAAALKEYANRSDTIIIALPRGGVVVGHEVAQALNLPLDITSPRKIGAPMNPELAIGAITETGEKVLSDEMIETLAIPESYINQVIEKEKREAKRRLDYFRKGKPPRNLKEKIVIIVDDGLATGATMRAALKSIKKEGAKEVVVAVPVAPEHTLRQIEKEADTVICLATPPMFHAVGQFYDLFDQTSDDEVIELLGELSG